MMKASKLIKGIGLLFVAGLFSLSQVALAEVNISGWINEGVILYDDGQDEETVQATDNGTTLASRITFSGSTEIGGGEAGFEVILEPRANVTPLIFSNQSNFKGSNGHDVGVLGNSMYVKGAAGKLTVGLQSMPTDNIAVLEDPSLTLWSGISPVFRGNGFTIRGVNGFRQPVVAAAAVPQTTTDPGTPAVTAQNRARGVAVRAPGGFASDAPVWGDFLNCFTASGLRGIGGIGIDCNGIYRQGVRYDFPAFGPITVAIGWANSDVYDIALKYKGNMGRISSQFAIGWAINSDVNGQDGKGGGGANPTHYDEADNLQLQFGLMDPVTGIFGSFAYQNEEADLVAGTASTLGHHLPRVGTPADDAAVCVNDAAMLAVQYANCYIIGVNEVGKISDESDAWWIKIGIKKQFFSAGETSFAFDFGMYEDQYGFNEALNGVTGSEVERIGFSVDQYFGKSLIIYGKWEQLELDVSGTAQARSAYNSADDLSTLVFGGVYFF